MSVTAGCAAIAAVLATSGTAAGVQSVFDRDVAPVLTRCCVSCHREHGPGAYPFGTPVEVKRIARTLLAAIESGAMPPWSPVAGVVRAPERPTVPEIERIRAWVESGAPIEQASGSRLFAPRTSDSGAMPVVARWRVGDGWTVGASESRSMRSFWRAGDVGEDRLIGGWRTIPDAPGLVSLVLVTSGEAAMARALDERDASVGFRFTGDLGPRPAAALAGVGIDGHFVLPPGFAMRVRCGDALAVEMHAEGRGRDESGALLLEALAPVHADDGRSLRLVEPWIIGAQGAARASLDGARSTFAMPPLGNDADLAAITVRPGPYAARVRLSARSPETAPDRPAERILLAIDRYDVHLDRTYVVDPVVRLGRGTVVELVVEAENEVLAARSSPQAVLLVAQAERMPGDGTGTIGSAGHSDAAHPPVPRPAGARAAAFLNSAIETSTSGGLVATRLVDSAVFEELMGYQPEPRTGATDAAGFSWFEAIELANALSAEAGLELAYRIEFPMRNGVRLVGGVVTRTTGSGWRLPEGDEWRETESASRGLSGALWNWTFDVEGTDRIVRGGCWADREGTQGIDARSPLAPTTRSELFGARFVRLIRP